MVKHVNHCAREAGSSEREGGHLGQDRLGGHTIKRVEFKYLGSVVQSSGESDTDVTQRTRED